VIARYNTAIITPPPIAEPSIVMSVSVCVCVCVCVSAIISSELYTSDLHQISVHGSVLLWRRSDTLRTSGFIFFIDDVIFAHALRLLDVAARLR